MMKISVFVGTSVDGFIARSNGDLDFLSEETGEDHGFDEFMQTVDTVVAGRKTFEKIQTFGSWPYAGKRVVVLSSRSLPARSSERHRVGVEQMAGSPRDVAAELVSSGAQHVCIDGGFTAQRFLEAGLVQRLIVTRVPVLIGQGIPLFGPLPSDVLLRHIATRDYPSGFVQTEYEVVE